MCTHTLTHYRKVFRSLSLSTAFGRNQTQRQTSRTDRVAPARCKLCHAQENDNRKTIESSSKLKVQASFEFLRIWFSKFVLNLGRGWRQFNAHMLRFMCFVGFAWPECKTKRHFILCNISFFLPRPEVEQEMAEGVTLCLSASHKEILLLRLYGNLPFRKWVFMYV